MRAGYWRGVRRQARKETREELFGSVQKVLRDAVGYVLYLALAYLVLSKAAVQDELMLGLAAGAVPFVFYPATYCWKLSRVPIRLRQKASARATIQDSKRRTLEANVLTLENATKPSFTVALYHRQMLEERLVRSGWYLRIGAKHAIPSVTVMLDLANPDANLKAPPPNLVPASWLGSGVVSVMPIPDGTFQSALIYYVETFENGATPKVRWLEANKFRETSGDSFEISTNAPTPSPCTIRVIITSGYGSQTFLATFSGSELIDLSGEVPMIDIAI